MGCRGGACDCPGHEWLGLAACLGMTRGMIGRSEVGFVVANKPAETDSALERTAPPDRATVSVEQYVTFRRTGFLTVKNLVAADEIAELRRHTEDLMQGKLPEQNRTMAERDVDKDHGVTMQELEAPPAHLSPQEKAQHFLRI